MGKKKKKRRKPNLLNPNSMTWKKKADKAWAVKIRSIGYCEKCRATDKQLNAHHIIARTRLRFRHELKNGVCLCVRCHSFDPAISPHVDSFSGERFLTWLAIIKPHQFQWYEEHKHDMRQMEGTYQDKFEQLQ